MEEKNSLILLGIIAVLAIIGLILMFKFSATGMMARPALPPEIQQMERDAGVVAKVPDKVVYEPYYKDQEPYYMEGHALKNIPRT